VACGKGASNGYTAAVNQLTFGADAGAGDACGRCFKVTRSSDPSSPENHVKPTSIVVMVTDECPKQGNAEWCGQTRANPTNQHGATVQCVIRSPFSSLEWMTC
jgi:hypothetical protein